MSEQEFGDVGPEPELVEATETVDAPEPVSPEVAAEARKYGWKPREEYTKAPEGWVDADRFMGFASTQVKVLRDENRAMREQLGGIATTTQQALERVRAQEREAWEGKLAEVRRQQAEAVQTADVDAYNRARQNEAQMLARAPAAQPVGNPEVQAYIASNDWTKDQALMAYAHRAINETPGILSLPAMEQVKWAERQVRANFPDRFPAPVQAPPSMRQRVDGGGLAASRRGERGSADLPAEAKAVAESFVKEGVFPSVDAYAKAYFAQGGV